MDEPKFQGRFAAPFTISGQAMGMDSAASAATGGPMPLGSLAAGLLGGAASAATTGVESPESAPLDIGSYKPPGGGGGGGGSVSQGGEELVQLLRTMARGITSMANVGVRTIVRPQGVTAPGGGKV